MSTVTAQRDTIPPPAVSQVQATAPDANVTGRSAPFGATVVHGGVNFSLFSRTATAVELLFFDHEDDGAPTHTVRLDPVINHTYHYWHVFVPGIRSWSDLRLPGRWPKGDRARLAIRSE